MQRKPVYYDNRNALPSAKFCHERGLRESLDEARTRRREAQVWHENGLHPSSAAVTEYLAGEQKAVAVDRKDRKRRIRFPWL